MQRTNWFRGVWAALALLLSLTVASAASAAGLPVQRDRTDVQAFVEAATAAYNEKLTSSYKRGQIVVPAAGPNWTADLGKWVEYTFPVESGASCMNGTPYRMYYKIAPEADMREKVLVDFEGGGACWSFDTCRKDGDFVVANPDGLPSGYIKSSGWDKQLAKTTKNLVSPVLDGNTKLAEAAAHLYFGRGSGALVNRKWWNFSKSTRQPETQRWTKVVFPYCTGDVHSGASFRVFDDPSDPSRSKKVNFNGLNNVRAAMEFLRKTDFAQSLSGSKSREKGIRQMLVYGVSAGGYGSQVNYPMIREALAGRGTHVAMFSDSGPILPGAIHAPGEDIPQAALDATPAVRFWQIAADVWGWFQEPTANDKASIHPEDAQLSKGVFTRWREIFGEEAQVLQSVRRDISEASTLLSRRYAGDRLGLASFQRDEVIPRFLFKGGRNAELEGLKDDALHEATQRLFAKETTLLRGKLGALPNHGYYMPWRRNFVHSHVTTVLTFAGTDISRPANLHDDAGRNAPEFDGDVGFFLNNLISAKTPEDLPLLKEVGAPGSSFASSSLLGGILGLLFPG